MKALHNDERGVALVFELVLVAVVLGLVGLAIYTSMHHKSSPTVAIKSTPAPSKSPSPTATPTPDPYAGWKTFCSAKTNACFRYDPSWTLAECAPESINTKYFQNCPSAETVAIIAPTFRINWFLDPYDATKKYPCVQGKSYSDTTRVPDVSNLYFVNIKDSGSTSYDYTGFLALTTGKNGQPPVVQSGATCPSDTSFLSQDGKYEISFDYDYAVNTNPKVPASDPNPRVSS
jgi:hypothetical protein